MAEPRQEMGAEMDKGWEKINQLFHEALESPQESRGDLLARAAEHDPQIGRELESLLNAHDENKSFLEMPVLRVNLSPQIDRWQAQILASTSSSTASLMVGQLIDGKYRLEELCGRGGMGAVYRAMHVGTGRRVAVKVIAPELAGNREFIERFRREARTIGRLHHPNIVNVTDFGITNDGEMPIAYLVMEHLEGGTLAAKLKDKRPVSLADALDILRQTCAAIDEAHRLGILHRDLKPENIWLEPIGIGGCNVKVLDFGIALLQEVVSSEREECDPETAPVNDETPMSVAAQRQPFSVAEDDTLRLNLTLQQLTRSGTLMGSPKYMSPEQCRGEKLGEASDVYSLGVITYQMLTGELPFNGSISELLQQHCEAEPLPLSRKRRNLTPALDAVVALALAKDPASRPRTAGAFAFLLHLQTTGNDWLRERADVLNREHRRKLSELALRLQWRSWIVIGLILIATLKLPGLRPLTWILMTGLLWLVIAASVFWKQNSVSGAFALFLEKAEREGDDARVIVADVRRRSADLVRATFAELRGLVARLLSGSIRKRWADSLMIVPPLVESGLSVPEATAKSALLVETIRGKMAYAGFRRWLSLALALTTAQVMLVTLGITLDGGRRDLSETIINMPLLLALCVIAFNLSVKSSLEQAVLYLSGRSALGEFRNEALGLTSRHESELLSRGWWLKFKTYGMTGALVLVFAGLQLRKLDMMKEALESGRIYSVKALQATAVPLPFESLAGGPHRARFALLRKMGVPVRNYSYVPYGPRIIRSWPMTEFLLQKGVDVNSKIVLDGNWTPPRVGSVAMTPLHLALTDNRVELARTLIANGADVSAKDSIERTPLITAIMYCPAAIKLLLESGVDPNEVTRFGPSLLAAARYQWTYRGMRGPREDENATRVLLESGISANTRDDYGRNALMVMTMEHRKDENQSLSVGESQLPDKLFRIPTSERGTSPSTEFQRQVWLVETSTDPALQLIGDTLLRWGCDINAADRDGRTPLMYAVLYNRHTAVRLLVENGANLSARDNQGATALEMAKEVGNREIFNWLNEAASPSKGGHSKK
jgi:serine/threonine protein kinase